MGKKQRKEATYVTAETFKIHKKKSLAQNLSDYIKILRLRHADISTKQYLSYIHRFVYKFQKLKGALHHSMVVKTLSKIKICQKCDKWAVGTKKMIQCELCDDSFHIECIPNSDSYEEWRCNVCSKIKTKEEKDQEKPACQKCVKNKNQLSVKCLKCFKVFHESCYGSQSVVCGACFREIDAKIKKVRQLTIGQSFVRASIESSKKKAKRDRERLESSLNMFPIAKDQPEESKIEKSINESTNATMFSNSKRFKHTFPQMTPEQISAYKQKLLFAILSKNFEYTQNLYCQNCSLYDDNEDSTDFAICHMSFHDLKMFREYKRQPIGPFNLEYTEKMGWDVVADRDLPKGMIVCEYVGDVYTVRNALYLQEKNDSVMELWKGKNADQSLLIVPRRYTNIARFINGINNQDPKSKEKQNVEDIRCLVQGRPVVILYTIKAIKKGESLLYDYGAGMASAQYNTSDYE